PVLRDGPPADRRAGGGRPAAGAARSRFPPDAAPGAMDQRRAGAAAGGAPLGGLVRRRHLLTDEPDPIPLAARLPGQRAPSRGPGTSPDHPAERVRRTALAPHRPAPRR